MNKCVAKKSGKIVGVGEKQYICIGMLHYYNEICKNVIEDDFVS